MDEKMEIANLLESKQNLEKELGSMVYGSLELRRNGNIDYMYTHHRVGYKLKSTYVGEYSEELYNSVKSNNVRAKEIKKEIRSINSKLKGLNYSCEEEG